jgi:Na+/H+ antiporter NhaD/arsenite permease-like protein
MESILITIFVVGYLAIAFEHNINVNKAASALFIGCLSWLMYMTLSGEDYITVDEKLLGHLGEISQILFFLLGAMTIVEIIDAHNGFQAITKRITTQNTTKLLWIIASLAFFLSAVLDNLTTTIVMITIVRKMIKDRSIRLYFISLIVIAANAGGAWSPIGDVTTTMLWIGGQISAANIMLKLFIPSLICMIIPIFITNLMIQLHQKKPKVHAAEVKHEHLHHGSHHPKAEVTKKQSYQVLIMGVLALVLVPIFKTVTHLPPFMGVLMNLGVLWIYVEVMHRKAKEEVKGLLSVMNVIRRVDVPSVLFFLGILMAVACLQEAGILKTAAKSLEAAIGNIDMICIVLGLLSAIVDNVPLVAAAMGMYSLEQFPQDHNFWELIAFTTGTGGSSLIIGSAAGVAAMGLEKVDFFWYLKNISWIALAGYFGGIFFFLIFQEHLFGLF